MHDLLRGLKHRVKGVLEGVQQQQRQRELQATQPHVGAADIAAGLQSLGVQPGDTLFVHSSLKSLGFVEGGPAAVISALQQAVGPEGTLLLPTYYQPGGTILGTCEMPGYEFDIRVHGSSMGALPAHFLATPGVQRSLHPTHSVSALGRHARWLTEAHHLAPSVFGAGSPWQRFAELPQAKVLGLGISMGPVTFYHLLEDDMGEAFPVPVWHERRYTLPCVDAQGQRHGVPVRPFKPDLMQQRIDHPAREDMRQWFAAEFDALGLRRSGRVGQAPCWFIPADPFRSRLRTLAEAGITIYAEPGLLEAHAPGSIRQQQHARDS